MRSEGPSSNGLSEKGECSLTPEQSEEASRLLRAAHADLRAARLLAGDAEQDDAVVGFHAQQAVEKAIKASLVVCGAEIPYSHDLGFLLDILAQHVSSVPESVGQSDWLTPWAVAARYGVSDAPLDRTAAVATAEDTVTWATKFADAGA